MSVSDLDLLPRELLVRTSDIDHADWNYRPLLGRLQRVRFQLARSLLRNTPGDDLLEVGYGSGVFLPELRKACKYVSGIDRHDRESQVSESLASVNVKADLRSGSVSDMPFNDDSFDVVMAVSTLEYVKDIDDACREIDRVLKPTGSLILVTPGKSQFLDACLKFFGNEDADSNYGDRREKLVCTLDRYFATEERICWPRFKIPWLTIYRGLRLKPRSVTD